MRPWVLLAFLVLLSLPSRGQVIDAESGVFAPKAISTAYVGDLDTAPNGVLVWIGMEAPKAALRGSSNPVMNVCMPNGNDCAAVGTDATTGQITPATMASATTVTGSPNVSTCNNTTVVCTLGSGNGTGTQTAFYSFDPSAHNVTIPAGTNAPILVVPSTVDATNDCPGALSNHYCAKTAGSPFGPDVASVAATCPCSFMGMWIDTSGAVSYPSIDTIDGNPGLYSNSGVTDCYTTTDNNDTGTAFNHWQMGVCSDNGGSGFFQVNSDTSVPVSTTFSGTSAQFFVGGRSSAGTILVGYLFKVGLWQNNATANPVSSANAATMISNTRSRLSFY